MEKTIYLNDKEVRLKSTAATPRIYRTQFGGVDFFADIMKLVPLINEFEKGTDFENLDYESISNLSFEVFENILWVLAKTADRNIPEPLEWLDSFETLDLENVMPAAIELISSSFQSKKKNHPAMENR